MTKQPSTSATASPQIGLPDAAACHQEDQIMAECLSIHRARESAKKFRALVHQHMGHIERSDAAHKRSQAKIKYLQQRIRRLEARLSCKMAEERRTKRHQARMLKAANMEARQCRRALHRGRAGRPCLHDVQSVRDPEQDLNCARKLLTTIASKGELNSLFTRPEKLELKS